MESKVLPPNDEVRYFKPFPVKRPRWPVLKNHISFKVDSWGYKAQLLKRLRLHLDQREKKSRRIEKRGCHCCRFQMIESLPPPVLSGARHSGTSVIAGDKSDEI